MITPTKHTLPNGYALDLGEDSRYHVRAETGWRGYDVRYLAETKDEGGYIYVRVTVNGQREKRFIHKLVCRLAHGERPSDAHEVCHADGDRSNNLPGNLRWGTRKQNADDREAHGRTSRGIRHSHFIKAGLAGGVA